MVGLVNNDPVRPAGGCPELLELRQKRVEERWPSLELDAEQIDDHVLRRLREHVKHFGDTRLALRIAEYDRSLELGIVAFWIDDAELVLALRETFENARGQRRFAAPRRASEQDTGAVGLQQDLRAIGAAAQQDSVAPEPWFEIAQIDGE
jgi:hypothetical protein